MNLRYDPRALRRLRLARGLDMVTVAKRARMTRSNVSMLDRGVTDPRAKTLAKLANVLGVSVQEFYRDLDALERKAS